MGGRGSEGCAAAPGVRIACVCGLACFFREIGRDAAAPVRSACAVFEANVIMVEEIQRVNRRLGCAVKLRRAVNNFLMCYHKVFGPASMTQKFHYIHHLSDYVARWGHVALPSCWTLERKHKDNKRFANALMVGAAASDSWDGHVLKKVTEKHLWALSNGDAFKVDVLVDKARVSTTLALELTKYFGEADFYTSPSAKCAYQIVTYGDLVLFEYEPGQHVVAEVLKHICFNRDGNYYGLSLLQPSFFKRDDHARCSVHVQAGPDDVFWAYTSSIVCSLTWAGKGHEKRVLRPVPVEPRWGMRAA